MGDNVYVLEILMRARMQELHAEAAREHLVAGLPARASLVRRALSAALGVMRTGGQRSTALAPGVQPR